MTTILKHLFFSPPNPTEYEYYYYDLPTEVPAEDYDLTLDDWLYELLDVTGKQPKHSTLEAL